MQVSKLIERLPPVTTPNTVELLTARLAEVAAGRAFLLQGGDCAETFAANTQPHVSAMIETLLQMARICAAGLNMSVVIVARLAGQYAKPRTESIDAAGLPVYRGDSINSSDPTIEARIPDPTRMLRAYLNSRATMRILEKLGTADVFVSHEALLLDYERAFLRAHAEGGIRKLYDLSAHFLWIGDRTRQPDGAHIALATLLANPIGIKIGPSTSPATAVEYAERLNPGGVPGRLSLISRMGSNLILDVLPTIVEKVRNSGHEVTWLCDPMHGNSDYTMTGQKTRRFDRIVGELRSYLKVHSEMGTNPGGIHIELAGEDVTECIGGSQNISECDLATRYDTACDPRLNRTQAVELAHILTEAFR